MSKGPDSAAGGPPARSDSEARSIQERGAFEAHPLHASSLLSFLTWQGSSCHSPPVEVIETSSSLLDYETRLSLRPARHLLILFLLFASSDPYHFISQKLTVPTLSVSTLIILRVLLDQFILLSTSGTPHVLICHLRPILQSTVCNVPSRRACLIHSLLPILLCASNQSHPSSFPASVFPED